MTEDQKNKFWEQIIDSTQFRSQLTKRKRSYINESIFPENLQRYLKDDWVVEKEFKTKIRLRKNKPLDMAFEDEVWTMFANMDFNYLNKGRNLKLLYSSNPELTQQIDVFAADDESILIVECKASETLSKKANLKETIEAIGGKKAGILKNLKKLFPHSKHKVKFILATKNYLLSLPDEERLKNYGILHFDDETIDYYNELTKHLGISSRFQFLGNLFEGQEIPELDNLIPAIRGKMGGHTYYSFSIEPEKLLKIGYVLHRNKANKKLMPTYQRLIKRSRLKAIQEFVEDGGFFPNSLIIDLETKNRRKGLQFDPSDKQTSDSLSKIGILHLPKKYRSAFIIDGQHRLYGYANSDYKSKNTVPVIAFVNMERKEQVRLFMQINENQKAVPKNLRNTLNADLLWNSDNLKDQIKALKLQLAQDLGEEKTSPLFERVIVGENRKTSKCCITIDSIKIGLDRSNFFGQFTNTAIKEDGTFYKGNNDDTYDVVLPFLESCFGIVRDGISAEWEKGEDDNGFLTINAGIESLIRIFSDIIDHLVRTNKVFPKTDTLDKVLGEVSYYLNPLIEYFTNLEIEEKVTLRKSYGTGGRARYWRTLQQAINKKRSEFDPPGLQNYWKDEDKRFNEESFKIIRDLETYFKEDFKTKLDSKYGDSWFRDGLPKKVYDKSIALAASKNYEEKTDMYEAWDCLNIIDYRSIATYGSNWSELFEKGYVKPGEEKMSGGKDAKTKWMQKLERIRNQNVHSYSVKEDEHAFLVELHDWLIKHKIETE